VGNELVSDSPTGQGRKPSVWADDVSGMLASDVVATLVAEPVRIADARKPANQGGLPSGAGFYAWWTAPGTIPSVPARPHTHIDDIVLFYVGISPASAASYRTVRSRVLTNHLSGNLGSSTFRLTLASLLLEKLELHPIAATTKVALTKIENDRLSSWQQANLALTWCVVPEPWALEAEVIRIMQPPLNLAINPDNPFGKVVREKRAALRLAASTGANGMGNGGEHGSG
jgi:hypothetical protein